CFVDGLGSAAEGVFIARVVPQMNAVTPMAATEIAIAIAIDWFTQPPWLAARKPQNATQSAVEKHLWGREAGACSAAAPEAWPNAARIRAVAASSGISRPNSRAFIRSWCVSSRSRR